MDRLIPDILYSDKNILVLNKPAGMIVNNADTAREVFTVQDFVKKNYIFDIQNINSGSESEFLNRGGIVHRLDKETSGILLVALNEDTFRFLQKQFKEKTIKKEYIALCHGKLIEEGEINVPIGRLPWNRMRFGVLPQGRESYTKFETIKYYTLTTPGGAEILSLVNVYPLTGRTHQIRVHFQYAGHPIFADSLYAGRKNIARDRKLLGRHFLHASKITFISPSDGKKISITSSLSSDLVDFLSKLS